MTSHRPSHADELPCPQGPRSDYQPLPERMVVATAELACDRAREREIAALRESNARLARELTEANRLMRIYRAVVWVSFWCSLLVGILKTL